MARTVRQPWPPLPVIHRVVRTLDVNANSTADGAAIIQWTDNGATNQQWQLVATTGVTFYQDADFGGTASQVFAKGNYTMAQLNAKGCPND